MKQDKPFFMISFAILYLIIFFLYFVLQGILTILGLETPHSMIELLLVPLAITFGTHLGRKWRDFIREK